MFYILNFIFSNLIFFSKLQQNLLIWVMAEKEFLIIPMTDDSPEVRFDLKKGLIRIFGPSFPENPIEFYGQILKWLELNENSLKKLTIEFDYSILSSASNKMVFELFIKFENLINKGIDVRVKWYYSEYDEDMYDEGKNFKFSMKVPLELIKKEE